ncbi:14111_t:CDS:10, partial [Acaulospora colombiana]
YTAATPMYTRFTLFTEFIWTNEAEGVKIMISCKPKFSAPKTSHAMFYFVRSGDSHLIKKYKEFDRHPLLDLMMTPTYLDFSDIEKEKEKCKLRMYAKTAVRSCTISHMLTCSLRGSERTDIVFAKETALELLEIVDEGTLNSIIEQSVFGTIKDIRVLHCVFSEPVLYDPIEGKECVDPEKNSDLRVIPGQDILVCLSDSGTLSFLAYTERASPDVIKGKGKANIVRYIGVSNSDIARMSGKFQSIKENCGLNCFIVIKIHLAKPGFDFKDLGRIVCVDPMGRLIAVAAWYSAVQIFSLPNESIFSYDSSDKGKSYSQEGVIWNMTFLYSSDESRALLAMVVVDDEQKSARIVIYNFLATEKLNSDAKSTMISLEKALMSAFAYPMDTSVLKRTAAFSQSPNQYVYAGMENGGLYRIDIISEKSIGFTLVRSEGINPVGSSMTTLCLDPEIGDFVLLSGDMSDGVVVRSNPKSRAEITYEIPNWAPMWDFQMLDLNQEGHKVIFSCSGRDQQGSIRVIRKSVGVNVLSSSDYGFEGVVSLWNLKYDVNDAADTFLALTFVESTRLMQMTSEGLDDISYQSGFNLEVCSILVTSFESRPGYLVQIYQEAIIVSKPNTFDGSRTPDRSIEKYQWLTPENKRIELAAIYGSLVVMSLTNGNSSMIFVLELYFDTTPIITFSIDATNKIIIPESICIVGNEERAYFLAGNREGAITTQTLIAENKLQLSQPISRRIGAFPVKLIVPNSNILLPVDEGTEAVSRFHCSLGNQVIPEDQPMEVLALEAGIEIESQESSPEIRWDVNQDIVKPNNVVVGCSLLGSVFSFTRIVIKDYNLLLGLQTALESWSTTRPCLGNNNEQFRKLFHDDSTNLVIDGEMVSQFLKLSRSEQCKVVDSHPKLIEAGTIFLRGEQSQSEEELHNPPQIDILEHRYDMDEDFPIPIYQNEDYEMNVDREPLMEQDVPEREFFGVDKTEDRVDGGLGISQGTHVASTEEIVDALQMSIFILWLLLMVLFNNHLENDQNFMSKKTTGQKQTSTMTIAGSILLKQK